MFKRLCLSSVLLMGAFAASAAAEGHQTVKRGQAGGWQIRVDRSHCFAQQLYADGTALRIGFNSKDRTLYIMLGNDAWRSLEAGKQYVVQAVFDNGKRYDGDLVAGAWGDRIVLSQSNIGAEFARDFMERASLQLSYQGARMVSLSLRDSYAAVAQAAACQKEIGQPSDPFAQ